ncbi:MAG: ABC transporter permease [Planctomycetales bacterium]|nr:ABC transporter permease [Planctomycetales bacterium]
MAEATINNDQSSEKWTVEFSPESQVRHPIRLIKAICSDIWGGRSLAYRLFVRNLSGTYRQSFLGFLWILVPTIGQAASWTFLARQDVVRSEGIPGGSYVAFIAIGSILWQAFFDAVQAPLRLTLANQGLITKLSFPREALVLVAIGEVIFDFLIRFVAVTLVLTIVGFSWSPAMLYFPVFALGLILVGTGIGLLITPIGILYQDVGRTLTIIGPFWMLLTPVVYAAPASAAYQSWSWLNPPAAMLSAGRDLFVAGSTDMWMPALVWLAIAVPYLMLGLLWFRIAFRIFVERMAN